jgi:hypothetical protein
MPDTQEDVKQNVEETSDSTDTAEETEEVSEEQKQNQTEETQETTEEKPEIDYKAELAKAEEKAKRAKEIAQWERSKRKQLQKQESTEVEEQSETDIDSKLAELRREQAQDMIDDELDSITPNEDEKKLIQKIYESRITPTGYTRRAIKEDLALAKIIANRPLYEKQLVEKAKAQAKKELEEERSMVGASSGTSSGRRSPSAPQKVLSEAENKWNAFIEKAKARAERRR